MSNNLTGREDVSGVRQVSQRWSDAVAVADVSGLRQLMTDDVVVVHANGETVIGTDAVAAHLARSFAEYRIQQRVEPEETVVANDWAFERARVHTTMTARSTGLARQFDSVTLTILRRDGGRWRVARTIGVVEQQL
jgi:uncharacterized protein (TIGR02246 family)